MKVVSSDDVLWGAVSKRCAIDFRMGNPSMSYVVLSICEYVAYQKAQPEN